MPYPDSRAIDFNSKRGRGSQPALQSIALDPTTELVNPEATSAHNPYPDRTNPTDNAPAKRLARSDRKAVRWNSMDRVTSAVGTIPIESMTMRILMTGNTDAIIGA